MKKFKRITALLIALVMCCSYLPMHAWAATATLDQLIAEGATVTLDGTSEGEATVAIVTPADIGIYGVVGNWSTSEAGTNYLTLIEIGSDVMVFDGDNSANVSDGEVYYVDDDLETDFTANQRILYATYKVASNTPEGTYTVTFDPYDGIYDADVGEYFEVFTFVITVKHAAPACDHSQTELTQNTDKTHNVVCAKCGEVLESNVACTVDEDKNVVIGGTEAGCCTPGTQQVNTFCACKKFVGVITNTIPATGKHKLTAYEQTPGTCKASGYEAYWYCETGNKYYADAEAKNLIEDINVWMAEGGEGYLHVDTNNHLYLATPVDNEDNKTHTYKYECCPNIVLTTENHNYGENGKCVCGAVKCDHSSNNFRYESDGTGTGTHTKYCNDCGTAIEGETKVKCSDETKDHKCDVCCETLSTCVGTLIAGKVASCTEDGWKDYYTCSCGKLYADKDCTTEITDLEAWKTGDGKIAASHAYGELIEAQPEIHTKDELKAGVAAHYFCDVCDTYFDADKQATTLADLTGATPAHTFGDWQKDENRHWKECTCGAKSEEAAHTGGTATCTQKANCSVCGKEYGEKNLNNHKSTAVIYKNITATTHDEYYNCCETLKAEKVSHNYDQKDGKQCICGNGMEILLHFMVNEKVHHQTVGVEYGKTITTFPQEPSFGKAEFLGWEDKNGVTVDENYIVKAEINVYAQWKTGWVEIDGAWYYVDPANGAYATGLTRLPYFGDYAPNAEDKAYWEDHKDTSEYTDAETAVFYFDENGKLMAGYTGIVDDNGTLRYAVKGMIGWHVGIVKDGDNYYYFEGDVNGGGNVMVTGRVYATRDYNTGKSVGGKCIYFFDNETGKLVKYEGIVEMNEALYYFDSNNMLALGKGLVKLEDGYIYVRSNGQVALGDYWVTSEKANGMLEGGKLYGFGTDGYLTIDPNKNGIINGVYYKEGEPYYAGLIEIAGDIYYVRSNGQIATGWYYVTQTNGMEGFEKGMKLFFGEDGKLQPVENGIVKEEGELYYYEDNHIMYGAGLLKMEDGSYIYVRSSGKLQTGYFYITNTNGLEGFEKGDLCLFGQDGKWLYNYGQK